MKVWVLVILLGNEDVFHRGWCLSSNSVTGREDAATAPLMGNGAGLLINLVLTWPLKHIYITEGIAKNPF